MELGDRVRTSCAHCSQFNSLQKEHPMPRIQPVDISVASGDNAAHIAATRKMLGGVPNLFATVAHSPAAYGALLNLFTSAAKSSLGGRTGELVALTVAESNGCSYCLSAHSAIGQSLGLEEIALSAARQARSADPKVEAILRLARSINESRGHITDDTLATARGEGITDTEIVDVVLLVALNVFTNYLNTVADTTIDFPEVRVAKAA